MSHHLTEHHHHHIDLVAHNNSSHLSSPAADRNILAAPSQAHQNPIPRIILNSLAYNLSSSRKTSSRLRKSKIPHSEPSHTDSLKSPKSVTSPTVAPVEAKNSREKKVRTRGLPPLASSWPLRRSEWTLLRWIVRTNRADKQNKCRGNWLR